MMEILKQSWKCMTKLSAVKFVTKQNMEESDNDNGNGGKDEDGDDDPDECKVGRSPQHQLVQVALSSAKSR